MALDYQRLVRELFPRLTGGIRWGLDRTERMLADAGDPHRAYPVIHVGGTNGKGTVCAVAESILRAAGLRTGLYTSPHLTSFRERIRIDGEPIGEEALLDSARRLWPSIEREAPSFFEATTAIAFDAFARAGVDVAVVEVGLGGRLDATNVVVPEVAVVTQIGIDHVEFLGSDPKGIAREKAGIAKPGVPFLTAELDDELFAVLEHTAREAGATVHRVLRTDGHVTAVKPDRTEFDLATSRWGTVAARLPLGGAHQAINASVAVRAIELTGLAQRVDRAAIVRGVESTRWPGRFQIEHLGRTTWLFDVAHNPAAIRRLGDTVVALRMDRPLAVLLGVMADKDWRAMLGDLAAVADRVVVTRPAHAPPGRAWDPSQAAAEAQHAPAVVEAIPDLTEAVRVLRASDARTVVVTGSFHTVGEALIELGIDIGWAPDPVVDTALQP